MISYIYSKRTLICRFKFSNSLQHDWFWLADSAILFICAFLIIAVVWTLLLFNINNYF